jgi:CheY-like chemotaxis protein
MERSILEGCGYNIVEADTAKKAFDVWKEMDGRIDLMLTDITLPRGLTGVELAKRLLEDQPHLKVIFTTGRLINQADQQMLARMNARFLQKPFQHTDLIQVVNDMLGGSISSEVAASVA